MGGATSSTSKAAIIGPSSRPDSDIDYLVGQIDIDEPTVDYSSNCGNLASAVGPFAIQEGMMPASEGITEIRIWQANIKRRIIALVPTHDGAPVEDGDYNIDGVALPGAEITLDFLDPAGSSTGALLPTGHATDTLDVPGIGRLSVTLLDATLATVFVRASDLGLTGSELKPAIDGNPDLLLRLEAIRAHAAVRFGLAHSPDEATRLSPATPKVAFIGPAKRYLAADGRIVAQDSVDFLARIISMGALHHAYEVSGAIATAVAAAIPGTIVNDVARLSYKRQRTVRIGHTSGVISIGTVVDETEKGWAVERARISRTARRLMEGKVCVPASTLN
jgi:2-methylaconitate cis-trans-isomerase PrpF